MKFIFNNVALDDFVLATRAIRALLKGGHKDTIIAFGDGSAETKDFYVCRNKSSITVRSVSRAQDLSAVKAKE